MEKVRLHGGKAHGGTPPPVFSFSLWSSEPIPLVRDGAPRSVHPAERRLFKPNFKPNSTARFVDFFEDDDRAVRLLGRGTIQGYTGRFAQFDLPNWSPCVSHALGSFSLKLFATFRAPPSSNWPPYFFFFFFRFRLFCGRNTSFLMWGGEWNVFEPNQRFLARTDRSHGKDSP